MKSVEALTRLFREQGLKITPQRRVIFETLVQDETHPTAEEIYQRVTSIMPDISRTTIYNTLGELVSLGELTEVQDLSDCGMRYDTRVDNHHHLFCMSCQKLLDITHSFEGLEIESEEAAGYQVVKRQVTFYGYCPDCQAE